MNGSPWLLTLMGSLPALPRPGEAVTLPISPLRLEERLRLVPDAERPRLRGYRDFQRPSWRPARVSDAVWMQTLKAELWEDGAPKLRELVIWHLSLRLVFLALRVRAARQSWTVFAVPPPWRMLMTIIAAHWQAPLFSLEKRLVGIPELGAAQHAGDPCQLDQTWRHLQWQRIQQARSASGFAFEDLVLYVWHWQLLADHQQGDAAQVDHQVQQILQRSLGTHGVQFA